MGGCQNPTKVVPDEKIGNQAELHNQDMSGRGDQSAWGPPEWSAWSGEVCGKGEGDPVRVETQNEMKGWNRGVASDPLRCVDPWSRTADGVGIRTNAGDAGQSNGFSGINGYGSYLGQG